MTTMCSKAGCKGMIVPRQDGSSFCSGCGEVPQAGAHTATTARHFDDGKPPMALLPNGPLRSVAQVMSMGAVKYGTHNWRKGSDWVRYASSTLRHVYAWLAGEDKDPESGLPHLAHAVCNLLFLLEWQEKEQGIDDRYTPAKEAEFTEGVLPAGYAPALIETPPVPRHLRHTPGEDA